MVTSPKSFIGDKMLSQFRLIRAGDLDLSGRRRPVIEEGSDFKIPADFNNKNLWGSTLKIFQNYLTQKNLPFLNGAQLKLTLIRCKPI